MERMRRAQLGKQRDAEQAAAGGGAREDRTAGSEGQVTRVCGACGVRQTVPRASLPRSCVWCGAPFGSGAG